MPPSVGDFAMLSDCQSSALVDRNGTVAWWPAGTFDGPSVFSSLLDADAGHFTLRAAGPSEVHRRYVDGTLVLETSFRTAGGARLTVTDCLALEVGARGHEIGMASPHALVRVAEAHAGDVELEVELAPRPEYGLAIPRLVREDGIVTSVGGPERLFLVGGSELELDGGTARGRLRLRDGERRAFVLHRGAGVRARMPAVLDGETALAATIASWRSWSGMHASYDGPFREQVLCAARLVQGLTYQPSGAVVAAASTSLPEIPGGDANWDYRFGWLRDSSLVARALLEATCSDEAKRYFEWITRAAVSCRHTDNVQIVFGADGERNLEERQLDHLAGFRGARPVRVGNAAWRQVQLDVLGEVLDVAAALDEVDQLELDDFTASFLCQLVDRAERQWPEPDAGMWESREAGRHHTISKVMCWVALDRGVRLAGRMPDASPARWAAARDELRAKVLDEAFDEQRGAFVGELGGSTLDASVLLLPLMGFLSPRDPRMLSTMASIEEHLGADGLLRRREDMRREGAFLPACFWLSACHALAGRHEAAVAWFERTAACANDVGILAEMADPATGDPMGNTPQALTHVALIAAAYALGEADGAGAVPEEELDAAPR